MDLNEELVVKEKYGASTKSTYLRLKPEGKASTIDVQNKKYGDVVNFIFRLFLPLGYPESVSKDYMAYQIWDTAQAFCSTIADTLATQQVLRGIGVGNDAATPLAATVMWIIKNGCGHLGKIIFAYYRGSHLDAFSKKWRLYADILNDIAMCIEMALPLFNDYILIALCASTIMKAIVGVAGGATRCAMTQHHAKTGNFADVAAKDSVQETAVNLMALLTALGIIALFGNSLTIFIMMLILHITFNCFAIRVVCLHTFNETRFLLTVHSYLRYKIVTSPCKINNREPIFFYQLGTKHLDAELCGFRIKLGCSISKLILSDPRYIHWNTLQNIYKLRHYILYTNVDDKLVYVLFKEGASGGEMLEAYFHAVILSIIICAINDIPVAAYGKSPMYPPPIAETCETLRRSEHSRLTYERRGRFYEPSYDVLRKVDSVVAREWAQLKTVCILKGWELSKHLLIVDEWRIAKQS